MLREGRGKKNKAKAEIYYPGLFRNLWQNKVVQYKQILILKFPS